MPEENDSYPENEVISQDPPSGTVASVDDTITVFYATAEPIAFIPVVAGMSKNEAKEELSNFTVEFRQIYDSKVEEGLVIRTSPEGGMNVPKGSTIVVYISKGPQPVKVTFDYGDGSRSTTETKYYEKPYGSLPTPTRNGYTFSGWYLSRAYTREITSSDTVNNSEDHTLYARWTAGEYTVSFNSNGGSAVSPIGVTYGKKYGNLPLPTKPGYTFDGWYTDSGEKVTADSTVNVDRNHTLNAKWRENTYTVSFNTNGGSSVGSISVKYGDTYGTLPTTQKDYYTFTGWYTSPSGGTKVSSGDTFNSTSNITLYAQWKENGLSDWVLESEKPANADVFYSKWTYDETTYKTTTSNSEAERYKNNGYSEYKDSTYQWGEYGEWSDYSKNKPEEKPGYREIDDSKSVPDKYDTQYNYSRYTDGKGTTGPWAGTWSGSYCGKKEVRGWSTEKLSVWRTETVGGKKFNIYGKHGNSWYNEDTREVLVSKGYKLYRYRDRKRIETYYLSKTETNKESFKEVISGNTSAGTKISNVKKWVRFKVK